MNNDTGYAPPFYRRCWGRVGGDRESPGHAYRDSCPCTKRLGEQGWRSSESARLPPMFPGFDSRTRRQMWIGFVVGSRPCSEVFSPGSPVFLPPHKPTFLNSNSIGNSRTTGLSVEDLLYVTLVTQS